MNLEIVPAIDVPLQEQARIANEAFAGYVGGWAELDAHGVARFLMLQGADLFHSRFVRVNGELAGFGYITRTANMVRLSGMALLPSARGTGAAAALLTHLCEEAQANGDEAMTLEVIEQNPRAVALYRRQGFRDLGRLLGWRCKPDGERQSDDGKLHEVGAPDALSSAMARDYPDVPWQISRHAISKVARITAFELGDARVFISHPETTPIRVYGLHSSSPELSPLREALRAVAARFPQHEFFAPPLWPEEFGNEIFAPLGFAREPLNQLHMRRDFLASR